jgi:hypothetical protein
MGLLLHLVFVFSNVLMLSNKRNWPQKAVWTFCYKTTRKIMKFEVAVFPPPPVPSSHDLQVCGKLEILQLFA